MIAGLRSGAVGRVGWAGRALMMEGRVLIMYTYECWGSSGSRTARSLDVRVRRQTAWPRVWRVRWDGVEVA